MLINVLRKGLKLALIVGMLLFPIDGERLAPIPPPIAVTGSSAPAAPVAVLPLDDDDHGRL